ncbi:hypothetical protein GQ54DRAFT_313358 [Martensiomyces pterosporus]|nr:hypothetical protein GQ54DRAFT_313358 [Martensiomyces pterosporus]
MAGTIAHRVAAKLGRYAHCFLHHNPSLRDELFATSYFIPQPVLALIRIVLFAYCLTVLIANLTVNIIHKAGWNWPAYFTTLTYFGITLYYGFAAYNTCRHTWVHGTWQKWRRRRRRRRRGARVSGAMISLPMPLGPEQMRQLAASGRMSFPPSLMSKSETVCSGTCGSASRSSDTSSNDIQAPSPPQQRCVSQSAEDKDIVELVDTQTQAAAAAAAAEGPSTAHQVSLALQWLLYETFTCYAPLVSLIYWGFLFPSQGGLDGRMNVWMGVSMHATNTILMVLEILVMSRCPLRWTHFPLVVLVLVLYLVLVYFMIGVYGFYVYPFFDAQFFGGYVAIICLLVSLALQWLLYETFTCYAPLVSLIYWGFLFPSQGGLDGRMNVWMGVSMHATNTILMVLEILVMSRCPLRWTHFPLVVLVLVLYLVLVYFMIGVYGFYVYPFFDAQFFGGYVAIICLLVVDIVGIVWVVLLMVHRWRDSRYPRWVAAWRNQRRCE